MDAEDRLGLGYDRTTELVQPLLDTRFKLLALVRAHEGGAVIGALAGLAGLWDVERIGHSGRAAEEPAPSTVAARG